MARHETTFDPEKLINAPGSPGALWPDPACPSPVQFHKLHDLWLVPCDLGEGTHLHEAQGAADHYLQMLADIHWPVEDDGKKLPRDTDSELSPVEQKIKIALKEIRTHWNQQSGLPALVDFQHELSTDPVGEGCVRLWIIVDEMRFDDDTIRKIIAVEHKIRSIIYDAGVTGFSSIDYCNVADRSKLGSMRR